MDKKEQLEKLIKEEKIARHSGDFITSAEKAIEIIKLRKEVENA